MSGLFWRFDWIFADLWQTKIEKSIAPPQSYPASIGSGPRPPIFSVLNVASKLSSAGDRQIQNLLIHLGLVNFRITYKNIDIFYIDPRSDLRLDLEASGCCDFDYVTTFTKF